MPASGDQATDGWICVEPSLESLFGRLEGLSLEPGLRYQGQLALGRALQPYVGVGGPRFLAPLSEEVLLAKLYLYADFYPEDGQLSLIEQLRDRIEVHIPEEEREWLDPLRHSYMDLLAVVSSRESKETEGLQLRSLGDGREFRVAGGRLGRPVRAGQVLFTRLVRRADRAVLPGTAVVLSSSAARSMLTAVEQERREMEALAGAFELGEWEEFAKMHGHLLMWNLARTRLETLLKAEAGIRYRTQTGRPFLYAVAFYDHHEYTVLARELDGAAEWQVLESDPATPHRVGVTRVWVQRASGDPDEGVVARLTVTPTQLWVECDSRERLDAVKHRLASTFGFSLHFRGEATTAPAHSRVDPDLAEEDPGPRTVVANPQEEHRLLAAFLDSVYLEWADRASPALGGETPRHAAAGAEFRDRVRALIDEVEGSDIALRRTGRSGYDYNRLRAHVGLE